MTRGSEGRDVIEHASGQVLGGVNGVADFLNANTQLLVPRAAVVLVPVIFTTASLWGSEVDLGTAALDNGQLPARVEAESLRSLGAILDQHHARSIAIVRESGIEAFISAIGHSIELYHRLSE